MNRRLKMTKLVSETGLNNICASMNKNVYECVSSFNSQHCVTDDTKIIIVGTITPPQGTNNGYFYTAPRNNIYGYIDEARGTNLKELKNKLNGGNLTNLQKTQIVNEIKDVLREQQIAFLDIMDKAIRKKGRVTTTTMRSNIAAKSSRLWRRSHTYRAARSVRAWIRTL